LYPGGTRQLASGGTVHKPHLASSIVVAFTLAVTVGCSSATPVGESPEAGSSTSASQTASPVGDSTQETLSTDAAVSVFLGIVCPTDSALHLLETVAIAAGDWRSVKPKDAQPYARSAIDAVRLTSQQLQREDWPDSVSGLMPEVAREYLALLTPLEEINQATAGGQLQGAWKRMKSLPRTAEQQVRVSVGLPNVGAADDGCPPAPKRPKPQALPTVTPSASPAPPQPATPTDYRTWLCTTRPGNLPAVSRGDSSRNVKLLQWSLQQLGYYRGAIGGNYGEQTFEATYYFQLDNGLGRTSPGSVGVNTWSWIQYYLCP